MHGRQIGGDTAALSACNYMWQKAVVLPIDPSHMNLNGKHAAQM